MTIFYLVTTYVLTLCACQVNVSQTCFSFSFQEWLETWTQASYKCIIFHRMCVYIFFFFKENIKILSTKFLIHSYERSGRHPFLNGFLFLLKRLFSRSPQMQKPQLFLQFTVASLLYSAVPIYGSLRLHPSMAF